MRILMHDMSWIGFDNLNIRYLKIKVWLNIIEVIESFIFQIDANSNIAIPYHMSIFDGIIYYIKAIEIIF
jgi:hypothetical protein